MAKRSTLRPMRPKPLMPSLMIFFVVIVIF
jgi:hypothetical protein